MIQLVKIATKKMFTENNKKISNVLRNDECIYVCVREKGRKSRERMHFPDD